MKTTPTTTILLVTAFAILLFAAAAHLAFVGSQEVRIARGLARMNGAATHAQVCTLMREGSKFRYDGTAHDEPQRPEVTEARRAGDCKDLALWLAFKLNDPSVMFVEGTFDNSPTHHAWLEWFGDGQLWILDLTAHFNDSPIPAADTHAPTSNCYYAPERLISKYGVFTSQGAFADVTSGQGQQPAAAADTVRNPKKAPSQN